MFLNVSKLSIFIPLKHIETYALKIKISKKNVEHKKSYKVLWIDVDFCESALNMEVINHEYRTYRNCTRYNTRFIMFEFTESSIKIWHVSGF